MIHDLLIVLGMICAGAFALALFETAVELWDDRTRRQDCARRNVTDASSNVRRLGR